MIRRALCSFALLASAAALADEPVAAARAKVDGPARNWANFRIGASSASQRPELCLELSPIERLSVEACGTGSGFLHQDPDPEIAHFRGKWRLGAFRTEIGWVEVRAAAGFAELQVGEDGPGFHFAGTGNGNETAGPEVGGSLRAMWPVYAGFELMGELGFSAGWFTHAPRLNVPQSQFQPSASFTLGFGF